jgi:hypothetical protein
MDAYKAPQKTYFAEDILACIQPISLDHMQQLETIASLIRINSLTNFNAQFFIQ